MFKMDVEHRITLNLFKMDVGYRLKGVAVSPPPRHPILIQGRVRARAMRAWVAVVLVGGCGRTEPMAVVWQWRSMVVVVVVSLPPPPSTTMMMQWWR
jgi:hypothetical protein